MIRLALLRHGHTAWNRAGRVQGRTDIPLDEDARDILAQLALPDPWDKADVVSSPLGRAVETAQLVAGRAPLVQDALMEMNWGQWEGRQAAGLRADPTADHRDIGDWGWHYTPPGGESPDALRARLSPWASTLPRDTVAVCHIGVMRVALALATDWHFAGPPPFQIKRNRLYVIEIAEDNWRLAPEPIRLKARAS